MVKNNGGVVWGVFLGRGGDERRKRDDLYAFLFGRTDCICGMASIKDAGSGIKENGFGYKRLTKNKICNCVQILKTIVANRDNPCCNHRIWCNLL